MKKIVSIIVCILLILTSVGCTSSPQLKANTSSAKGFILDLWEDKNGYYNAIFYNPESDVYKKIILTDTDKYKSLIKEDSNNVTEYLDIEYEKINQDYVVTKINTVSKNNTKALWLDINQNDVLFYLKEFCKFNHSSEQPASFGDKLNFILNYNNANCSNILETEYKKYDGEDFIVYDADLLMNTIKHFFHWYLGADKTALKDYGHLDETDNSFYCKYSRYDFKSSAEYFAKNYEQDEFDVINATIVELDKTHTPIEKSYFYKLGHRDNFILYKSSIKPVKITNYTPLQDYSKYEDYIYPIIHSPLGEKSWDANTNINKDDIAQFLSYNCSFAKFYDKTDNTHKIPFDYLYKSASKYFDINEDYYKTLNSYDEKINSFISYFGYENRYNISPKLEIDNVKQSDNELTIHFYYFIPNNCMEKYDIKPEDKVKECCLTLLEKEDGFSYKSLKVNDYVPKTLKAQEK